MSIVYPQESGSFSFDLKKNYWGSLFGSSEALALIELAESNKGVVLYIARDIAHHDEIKKGLLFLYILIATSLKKSILGKKIIKSIFSTYKFFSS